LTDEPRSDPQFGIRAHRGDLAEEEVKMATPAGIAPSKKNNQIICPACPKRCFEAQRQFFRIVQQLFPQTEDLKSPPHERQLKENPAAVWPTTGEGWV
jgi:hypothetical protein